MTDNCTSSGYGGQGCIGTAVSEHSSTLPMTGFDVLHWLGLLAAIVLVLVIIIMLIEAYQQQR